MGIHECENVTVGFPECPVVRELRERVQRLERQFIRIHEANEKVKAGVMTALSADVAIGQAMDVLFPEGTRR